MSRYVMDDETMVNTEKAKASWEEATSWNGNNHISKATGSQWEHETLYRSAKGRYWVEYTSQWQGSLPGARYVAPREAALWLLANAHDLPADLEQFEGEVEE